jgi:hypothetical protein
MAIEITPGLTEEDLDELVSTYSSGVFSTFNAFVGYVTDIYQAAGAATNIVTTSTFESNLDGVVSAYTDFITSEDYLRNNVGIKRDEVRLVLANSILAQSNELLDQSTLSSIMLREIFKDIIVNRTGDTVIFDTIPLTASNEVDRGKYFVED